MLAAYLVWHLRRAWAELCFTDETPPNRRSDPVAKAHRSPAAQHKASTRTTTTGQDAHSFETLLDHLATLTRNQVSLPNQTDIPTFEMLAKPTELQQRAFNLIDTAIPTRLS
jgi:hypothetical protein